MLGLMQILNYMYNNLGHHEFEIDHAFTAIVNGDETIESLLAVLGLEMSPLNIKMTQEKVSKWKSAFHIVKMRSELAE